eukprot:Colp12_sorted_trinity150504_noHs@11287
MGVSLGEARGKLQEWRKNKQRRSDETTELGEVLLTKYRSSLGDEVWNILEQVLIASLDCGRDDLANRCFQELNKQFPGSRRVLSLKGMMLESAEKWEEAEEVYQKLIEADPTNAIARKRKIAIVKAQGKVSEAIEMLNKYVQEFMADYEAWMELADLYISQQQFAFAAHCFEELIGSSPNNYIYHEKYAEVLYTQGTTEHVTLARKHFAQAVKLNPISVRALYGLFMASNATSGGAKSKGKGGAELADFAAQKLLAIYEESAPDLLQHAGACLLSKADDAE